MHWVTKKGKNSEMLFDFVLCSLKDSKSHRKYFGHDIYLYSFVSEMKTEMPV